MRLWRNAQKIDEMHTMHIRFALYYSGACGNASCWLAAFYGRILTAI
jgi:hypothetical protein